MSFFRLSTLIMLLCLLFGLILLTSPPTIHAQTTGDCTDLVGTLTGTWIINLNGDCTLSGTVTIDANATVTINGNGHTIYAPNYDSNAGHGNERHFIVNSSVNSRGDLTLNNITLTGGSVTTSSGGAIINAGTLSITGSTFSDNRASDGGAIFNATTASTTTVTNSTFNNNAATYGGAIYNLGTVNVDNSTFNDNEVASGGAIYNLGTANVTNSTFNNSNAFDRGGAVYNTKSLSITDSTFKDNRAAYGGAIYNDGGDTTVTNSTFNGNEAGSDGGGAILNANRTVTVTNSTFNDNVAGVIGGAILNSGDTTVTNSTFNGNEAGSDGSAIYNDGTTTVTNSTFSDNSVTYNYGGGTILNDGTTTVTNSILANSPSGSNCTVSGGTLTFAGMNIIDDDTCTTDPTVWKNADPLLAALANNGGPTQTMALQAGSPAIDAALNCTVSTDQRGISRPQGAACDIGAYEWQPTPEAATGPAWGDPFPCDSIEFVGGWGVFAEGTPASTAYTVPAPPAGYSYADASGYGGWCDVFTINQDHSPLPVEICWPSTGATAVGLYHDQPDLTRSWTILPLTQRGNNVCATLPAFGGVALLTGGTSDAGSTAAAVPANTPVGNAVNCTVTTTNAIIFRDGPGGNDIGRVMYNATLHATAEQDSWYQVEWLGQQGWISADYVTAVCE